MTMNGPDPAAPVLIAGAGIAGLTAALALSARGFAVTVLERRAGLRQLGEHDVYVSTVGGVRLVDGARAAWTDDLLAEGDAQ